MNVVHLLLACWGFLLRCSLCIGGSLLCARWLCLNFFLLVSVVRSFSLLSRCPLGLRWLLLGGLVLFSCIGLLSGGSFLRCSGRLVSVSVGIGFLLWGSTRLGLGLFFLVLVVGLKSTRLVEGLLRNRAGRTLAAFFAAGFRPFFAGAGASSAGSSSSEPPDTSATAAEKSSPASDSSVAYSVHAN